MSENTIVPYFLDDKKRDMALIFPGGAYKYTSWREGGPVAEKFNGIGWHAAVCKYRNRLSCYPEIAEEVEGLIKELRKDERINRIIMVGFSAGGHLALLLMTRNPRGYSGGVMGYPVVLTSGEYSHKESIDALTGKDPDGSKHEDVDIIEHISKDMPPLFVWHTLDDQAVPVENSFCLAKAMRDKKRPIELHVFPKGKHGLSLATEETPFFGDNPQKFARENQHVSEWFGIMKKWLDTI